MGSVQYPQILEDPLRNRGTAFTAEQRRVLGLDGLLPPAIETLDEQVGRSYEVVRRRPGDLDEYGNLRTLQDTTIVLFYRLLVDHLEEVLPIVHTPTVGLACQRFHRIFRRPRGLTLLDRYRDRLCTFNDDIQGTAAVALGALIGAVEVAGLPLPGQRVVLLGAGSAAIGAADEIRHAMRTGA